MTLGFSLENAFNTEYLKYTISVTRSKVRTHHRTKIILFKHFHAHYSRHGMMLLTLVRKKSFYDYKLFAKEFILER